MGLREMLSVQVGTGRGPVTGDGLSVQGLEPGRRVDSGTVGEGDGGDGGASNQPLFLTAKNLTFPGVTVLGGLILNFIVKNTGADGAALWIALAIALVFGGLLTWIGLTDPKNRQSKPIQLVVGIINTALLWIALFGVSSI